ncbi:MAG: hypothetical protein JW744_01655 [Candidatus Diapherotrites archaeon]|uniref:Uncharacterized protein n=1 Tax=Candidatus Iainarchaeum sp. TaxID=3101447 RepID=A0A938YXI9_9ARCH|nr:hypothetical protein [Candidatus Diapherotrites archaeon]
MARAIPGRKRLKHRKWPLGAIGRALERHQLRKLKKEVTKTYRPKGEKWAFFGENALTKALPAEEYPPAEKLKKGKGPRNREKVKLVMEIRGTAPLAGKRSEYIRKRLEIDSPKQVVLNLTLKRTLRAIVGETGMLKHGKKAGVGTLIRELFENKKISFKGGTHVDFSSVKPGLESLLGKKGSKLFMEYFTKHLSEEKNFFNAFIRQEAGRTILEKDW